LKTQKINKAYFNSNLNFQLQLDPEEVTIKGILCIARLKKMRDFKFMVGSLADYEENEDGLLDFIPLVVRNMPWLETIEDEHNDYSDCDPRPVKRMPRNLDVQGEFQLKELHATGTLPLQASFPNLYYVYFKGPLTDVKVLDILESYSNLYVLSLENVPSSQMFQILKVVGLRLEQLTIFDAPDPIDFANLFNLCPNLGAFHIDRYSALYSTDWSTLSCHNFRRLFYFSIDFQSENISSELLEFVFKAPQIQQIRFYQLTLKSRDLQMIKDLDENCLQHLHKLHVNQIHYAGPNAEDNIASFIKCIICKTNVLPDIEEIGNTGKRLYVWERNDVKYFFQLVRHLW
jgi:hypothetical protein